MKSWLPRRPADAHKGDFGHVLVVGGSRGFLGAPRLAAAGALRGGAGLVTTAVPASLEAGVAAGGPWESMTLGLPEKNGALSAAAVRPVLEFVQRRRVTSLALGPGLSALPGTRAFVNGLLARLAVPAVVDADALNVLEKKNAAPAIYTPHPGEAARLLEKTVEAVQNDRPAALAALVRKFGGVWLLKGRRTLISDGRNRAVNATGNPGMASGGMGDVLTGLIAALAGQVVGPQKLWRAAVIGAHVHGLAGDIAASTRGQISLAATDILEAIPRAFLRRFGR